MYKYIKRLLDIMISLVLLPFVVLLIIIIGFCIKCEDSGPIFYCAKRIGKNKKIFNMYKFRSMKVDAPDIRNKDGSTFNSENDPRVTKVGKFIRKSSLDEVPQLLNVLVGDMSFIGPRPDAADWVNNYVGKEKIIHSVRPGITGYNQAVNRNAVGTKEKLRNDIYYVEHVSFLFDIKILLMTVKTVLFSKNVYRGGDDCNE